tara:strand:+ start:239 stop:544 length:306 start_codon:yes stop_codon:yes gene_type:complete
MMILDKIDHIALEVKNIKKSSDWYLKNFKCKLLYLDHSWAFIEFDNTKLALVTNDEHPPHVAVLDKFLKIDDSVKRHRDGSYSKYIVDLDGNKIELIRYTL